MKVQPFIQASYTRRSQEIACLNFADTTKSFIRRRVYGAAIVAFASLRDAFHAVWLGLVELKRAVTDRSNFKKHLRDAVNYFVLAKLFSINVFFNPTVNFLNPNLYIDIVNFPEGEVAQLRADLKTKSEEADQLRTALETKSAEAEQHQRNLGAVSAESLQLRTALGTKSEEAEQLRTALGTKSAEADQLHTDLKEKEVELNKVKETFDVLLTNSSRKFKSTPSKKPHSGSVDDSQLPSFARQLFQPHATTTSSDTSSI